MGNTLTAGHAPWHDSNNVHGSDFKHLPPDPGNNGYPTTRSKASAPYDAESPTEEEDPGLSTRRGQPLSRSLSALRDPVEAARRREDGTTTQTTTTTTEGEISSSMRNLSHGDLPPSFREQPLSNAASYGSSTSCTWTGKEESLEIVVDTTHAPTRPTSRPPTGGELATKIINAQRPGSAKKKELPRVNSLMHIMDRTDQKQLSGSKTVLFTTAVREKRQRSKLGSGSPNSRASSARTSVETVASSSSTSSSASHHNDDQTVNHDGASEPVLRSASFHASGIRDRVSLAASTENESESEPLPRRRKSLAKSNSCSTLFVDSTLNKADLHGTLHCIATALLASIQKNYELATFKTNDIFSELLHPLLEDRPLSRPDRPPTEDEIYNFLESLFDAASLNAECAIITLIYIERMLFYSDITLHACNWARVLLGGLLLACKVWDDQAVWNADFCKIFPAVQVSDMNRLERWYICAIQHNVSIKASLYAKYYFELRDVAERSHRRFELRPLSIREAQRLETRSRIMTAAQNSQKSVLDTPSEHDGMRRTMSDNLFVPNTPATLM